MINDIKTNKAPIASTNTLYITAMFSEIMILWHMINYRVRTCVIAITSTLSISLFMAWC